MELDYFHEKIHSGDAFRSGYINLALANTASLLLFINPNENELHIHFSAGCGGDAVVSFYRATVASSVAVGTLLRVWNLNDDHSKDCTSLFYRNPVIVSTGSLMFDTIIFGGEKVQGLGGEVRGYNEFVLEEDRNYLLKVKNISGGGEPAYVAAEFYIEHYTAG